MRGQGGREPGWVVKNVLALNNPMTPSYNAQTQRQGQQCVDGPLKAARG